MAYPHDVLPTGKGKNPIVVVSSYFSEELVQVNFEPMPTIGEAVDLPPTFGTIDGRVVPALGRVGSTFILVTSVGCPVCQRELSSYPGLLRMARESGFTTRMLVRPTQSAEENQWFLERVPDDAAVVWDTLRVASSILQVRVTPSAVIVTSDGIIKQVFHPSREEWPVTADMLAGSQERESAKPEPSD